MTIETDWDAVLAILHQRFPLQLEIAILQERVNRLENDDTPPNK